MLLPSRPSPLSLLLTNPEGEHLWFVLTFFFKKARVLPALEMKIRDFCLLMESNRVQGNALSFFVS